MTDTLFPLPEATPPSKPPVRGKLRLAQANRQQVAMRLASLDQLLPDDHRARVVWAAVEQFDLQAFYATVQVVEGEAGRPAIDPALLVALWLNAALDGVGSARALDRLCQEHLAYQWLLGGVTVNYHTLADFRVAHEAALDDLLVTGVAALMQEGLVELQRTAQDGIRIRASAGASSFHRRASLDNCLQAAQAHVEALKTDPDAPDGPAGGSPARARHARERVARVQEAIIQLGRLEQEKAQNRESRRNPKPVRASSTDPAARVLKLADGGFRPGVSGQVTVDMDSRIIVAVTVTNRADTRELVPLLDQVEANYGRLMQEHYVDGGYRSNAGVTSVTQRGVTIYTPIPACYNKKSTKKPEEILPTDTPEVADWKRRMVTEAAKRKYRDRAATVEWANALLRQRGLQRLLVRGLQKARSVLLWLALAHNLVQAQALRRARPLVSA